MCIVMFWLVARGVFRLRRNPIYWGDVPLFLASIVWWDVSPISPRLLLFMPGICEWFIKEQEVLFLSPNLWNGPSVCGGGS